MRNFIRLCVDRPVTIIMSLLAIILAGIFCAIILPIDRLPEINFPRITVETNYYGMDAEEIRSTITIPIEDILSPVKGLERISSISRSGDSIVILDFRWGINPTLAAVSVREAMDAIYASLPEGAEKPVVVLGSSNDDAHAVLAVRSLKGDSFYERNFCEYELRNRLRRVENVGNIILSGGNKKEIHITADVQKTAGRKLTPDVLANMIAAQTAELPAGNAKEGDLELVVLSSGKPKSVKELQAIVLQTDSGPLALNDIANIKEGAAKKKSLFVYNGKAQTSLDVYRRTGSDPVALSLDLKKLVKEINTQFQNEIEVNLVYDSVPEIISSLINLCVSMALGAIAVTLVLIFFLRTVRYSLLAAFSIIISAAFALIVLFLFGKSLNSMSLSGLALGIGLVSDTSVIILDVLCSNFSNKTENQSAAPSSSSISSCVSKLSASSFGGSATTAVVFLPIIFLPGALGALFGDLSIAIVASVLAGWAYSQFALPVLFKMFFKNKHISPLNQSVKKLDLQLCYRAFLRFSMRKAKIVFLVASLVSIVGFVLLTQRPVSFTTTGLSSEINIKINYPSGATLDYMLNDTEIISGAIAKNDYIDSVFCKAGAEIEDVKRRSSPDYRSENVLYRCFAKKNVSPDKAMQELMMILKAAGYSSDANNVQLSYPQDKTEIFLGLNSGAKLALKGSALSQNGLNQKMVKTAISVSNKINNSSINDVSINIEPLEKEPQIRIVPKRDIQVLTSVTTANIANIVASITDGYVASTIEIDGQLRDVRVLGNEYKNSNSMELKAIPIGITSTGPVFLGTVSNIQRMENFQALARLDRSDVIYINVSSALRNKKQVNKLIDDCLVETKELTRIDDSTFSKYKSSLILTILLVLVLLYMTMGAQFESFILPFIFMITIPLALAGAGPALTLSGSTLDFGAALGIIVLLGIVVNNGIVLYETCEEKVNNGMIPLIAVYSGASQRLKPVLATTVTTMIVLVPLLVSTFAATQKSMACAMLGGCFASAVLTLFVLPPIFVTFFNLRACRRTK
ncbi:MAG: efflux RND transporter permease subunit [Termitinemataceae bacterium]|nr:MAG: efflux RND transporter permease subunit [Termitinemataceae bacterium]